jgi:beta-lactamase class A
MTSIWSRIGLSVSIALGASVGASATIQAARPPAPAPKPAPVMRPSTPAPAALHSQIVALGRAFDGKVGIAVRSIDNGWELGWKDDDLYPQQSVSKLWVAVTALDAVDKGRVSLDDQVTLTRSDLTVFHQPIAAKILGGSRYTTSLGELMFKAITTSDNTCNDKLMRSVGGADAVRRMIRAKGLGAIRFYNGERNLQSKIAGLTWSPSYSIGRAFFEARNALPMSVRRHRTDPRCSG